MGTSSVIATFVSMAFLFLAGFGEANNDQRLPHERFNDEHYKDGHHNLDKDHQAFLGSKKVAEEFDQLSPEESKRRLGLLAKKIDVNQDGKVSKEELTAWIKESLKMLDAEEIDERFKEIDDDKDGKISWDEYKKDAFGDDEEQKDMDDHDRKLEAEDKKYFDSADRNVNGKLEKTEFAAFQNPEHHDHMHGTLVDITLKDKDKNNDDLIDFNEFMAHLADKPDTEVYELEKGKFENEFDKNNDKVLDRNEMKKWLIPDLALTASEEANHLFGEADKNKDEQLTVEEIVEEHQLFVGSEATNYGEHLTKYKDDL